MSMDMAIMICKQRMELFLADKLAAGCVEDYQYALGAFDALELVIGDMQALSNDG